MFSDSFDEINVGNQRYEAMKRHDLALYTESFEEELKITVLAAKNGISAGNFAPLANYSNAIEYINHLITDEKTPESFQVFDVYHMADRYRKWNKELKDIVPYYSVKTNPNPILLRCYAELGCGF